MINYTSGQGLTMGSPFVFCSFVMLVLYAILPGAEAITMAHSVFFPIWDVLGCWMKQRGSWSNLFVSGASPRALGSC